MKAAWTCGFFCSSHRYFAFQTSILALNAAVEAAPVQGSKGTGVLSSLPKYSAWPSALRRRRARFRR